MRRLSVSELKSTLIIDKLRLDDRIEHILEVSCQIWIDCSAPKIFMSNYVCHPGAAYL